MGDISKLESLRRNFNTGVTKSYDFRKEQLKKLKKAIILHEQDLYDALYADLKKSPEESWVTEIGLVLSELKVALRNLRDWMNPDSVSTNLLNLPSVSRIINEPLGVVLIIS